MATTISRQQILPLFRRKVSPQFPNTPDGRLMFVVVAQAVSDLQNSQNRYDANKYLQGRMIHAEVCGVDPQWIRNVLRSIVTSANQRQLRGFFA